MAHQTIGGVAGTACSLMGVDCAGGGLEDPFAQVLGRAKASGVNRCDRTLLYAPDAIGLHLCEAYPEIMRPVAEAAPTVVRLKSVFPPAEQSWRSCNRLIGFVPDHGGHVDPVTGRGTHGIDIPEDMDVQHFFGVFRDSEAGPTPGKSA